MAILCQLKPQTVLPAVLPLVPIDYLFFPLNPANHNENPNEKDSHKIRQALIYVVVVAVVVIVAVGAFSYPRVSFVSCPH